MRLHRMTFVAVLIGLLIGGMAIPTHAATVITAFVPYTFGPTQTEFNDPILVTQFDPAAYGDNTLNSVHIILTGIAESGGPPGGSITCENGGLNGTCDGDLNSQITITLTAPGGLTLAQVIPLTTFTYTGLLPGQTIHPPVQTDTKSSGTLIYTLAANPAIIAAFLGPGTVSLNLNGAGVVNSSNGNGFVISGNPLQGGGTVQVAYDYETIPEPGAFVLLGSGLIGLALFRRKH